MPFSLTVGERTKRLRCVTVAGSIRAHPHLRMAKYSQHFVDSLDLSAVRGSTPARIGGVTG
jgi:hypothetical protein